MWKQISDEMAASGYEVSSTQVENKFKTIERAYKNMMHHNKKTGRGRMSCRYESELTDILGEKHNITPLVLSSSKGLSTREDCNAIWPHGTSSQADISSAITSAEPRFKIEAPIASTSTDVGAKNKEPAVPPKASSGTSSLLSKRVRPGATASSLSKCQEAIQQMTNQMKKNHEERQAIMVQCLEDYKAIRRQNEERQRIATEQRKEKNDLLKELIELLKKKET